MNVVLSNVEESIHHVDISEDGTPSAPRVRPGIAACFLTRS